MKKLKNDTIIISRLTTNHKFYYTFHNELYNKILLAKFSIIWNFPQVKNQTPKRFGAGLQISARYSRGYIFSRSPYQAGYLIPITPARLFIPSAGFLPTSATLRSRVCVVPLVVHKLNFYHGIFFYHHFLNVIVFKLNFILFFSFWVGQMLMWFNMWVVQMLMESNIWVVQMFLGVG